MDNKIAIVITTRLYPISDKWRNLPFEYTDSLDFTNPSFLDFGGKSFKVDTFKEKPSVKWRELGAFCIYIAPCLKENDNYNAQKAPYLELLLATVKKNCKSGEQLYLVAHDKDFKLSESEKNVDFSFVETRHIPEQPDSFPLLKRMIDDVHVFMFQHGDSNRLGQIIDSVKFDSPEEEKLLNVEDCEELLAIIKESDSKMAVFFRSMNKKEFFNLYPLK